MAQQYNATMDQLRKQATSREAELAQRMEEHSVAMKAKEKEVLDLQVTLTDTKERILREEERNRQQEQELFAENTEIRGQHTELKEMANELMLKWRIVNEKKEQLSESYNKLQEEGIITRERLRADWRILIDKHHQQLTKKVEESFGRAGEEWAAQAAELHILRPDAENRQEGGTRILQDGRSQYPEPPCGINRGLSYLGEIPHRGD